jgi:hypothetical protein
MKVSSFLKKADREYVVRRLADEYSRKFQKAAEKFAEGSANRLFDEFMSEVLANPAERKKIDKEIASWNARLVQSGTDVIDEIFKAGIDEAKKPLGYWK